MKKLDKAFERIAKESLGLETLEARNSDSLDFHEFSVWQIKDALQRAFKLGTEVGVACGITAKK